MCPSQITNCRFHILRFMNLLVIAICMGFFSCNSPREPASPPNVILIMADDLGYGDLSSYGNTYISTPNIDQLMAEGVRFTDYHSNGAVCSPTRAALMSGLYQQKVGIHGVVFTWLRDSLGMSQEVVTLAEVMKDAGYATGIMGKWHLGYKKEFNPVHQGFDEFKGYVAGNVDYHSHLDNQLIFDWWEDTTLKDQPGYSTDVITRNSQDFIKRHQDHPFFLYIPHEAPHDPYQRRNDLPVRVKGQENRTIPSDSLPGIYKEMVEVMDESVGEIMTTLRDLKLDDNTIVIFCSDNGANKNGSNGRLRGFKGGLYEGGHRVPAAVWWPGKIAPDSESGETVMSMDWFPTILAMTGISAEGRTFDGTDISPNLLSGAPLPERNLYWDYNGRQAIRQGDWKLVVSGKNEELFNLAEDPGEANDLSDPEAVRVTEMQVALSAWKDSWD